MNVVRSSVSLPKLSSLKHRYIDITSLSDKDIAMLQAVILQNSIPSSHVLMRLTFDKKFGWILLPLAIVKTIAFAVPAVQHDIARNLGTCWFGSILLQQADRIVKEQMASPVDISGLFSALGMASLPSTFEQLYRHMKYFYVIQKFLSVSFISVTYVNFSSKAALNNIQSFPARKVHDGPSLGSKTAVYTINGRG